MIAPWWRAGVLYQIYPRSFADSNGDGVGDLRGIVDRLDHLEWLGIDGIWLNPTMPSPNADWGYDVSDYLDVDPALGALEDLDELVAQAGERGIRVLLDLVPNHTSDRHEWFLDARSSREARHRDWYVWADPKPDGSPPNNWQSSFGGPAWTLDRRTGQYYLHNFLAEQPDLNWWNDEVRDAFDEIIRFWFDRGVAGFRIDVAHGIVKDRELRDDPPAGADDHPLIRARGLRPVYHANRPEVHEVLQRWRIVADTYEPRRILVGETWVLDVPQLALYYGTGEDELHLAFNFPFVFQPFHARALAEVVAETEAVMPPLAWPVWTLSNHDLVRFPTRWCGGDETKARCALLALLALRGTPVLYYGDELAMAETDVPRERLLDPVGKRFWPERPGRDGARTPMPWSDEPGYGFTDAGSEPWLPFGEHSGRTVADQRGDPGSTLEFCRDLIALRRRSPDLQVAPYEPVTAAPDVWAWRRGAATVALNLANDDVTLDGVQGAIALATRRERDGERVEGTLRLAAWDGVIVER